MAGKAQTHASRTAGWRARKERKRANITQDRLRERQASSELHALIDQISEQSDEQHLHARECHRDGEQPKVSVIGVVDTSFDNAGGDEKERRRDKDVQRLEVSANPDDQDGEVREVADGMNRGFANPLVVVDRDKFYPVMVRSASPG
jgi:hypothetical protein